jgi:hypothetical protein
VSLCIPPASSASAMRHTHGRDRRGYSLCSLRPRRRGPERRVSPVLRAVSRESGFTGGRANSQILMSHPRSDQDTRTPAVRNTIRATRPFFFNLVCMLCAVSFPFFLEIKIWVSLQFSSSSFRLPLTTKNRDTSPGRRNYTSSIQYVSPGHFQLETTL